MSLLQTASLMFAILSSSLTVHGKPDSLAVEFDKKGVSSILFRSKQLLGFVGKEPKGEAVASVWFEGENKQHYEPPPAVEWPDPHTAVRKYSWGTCTVEYTIGQDRLDMETEIRNETPDKTITREQCDLLYIRFPANITPLDWDNSDPPKNDNSTTPTVLVADFGVGKIVTVTPSSSIRTWTRWGPKQGAGYQLSVSSPARLEPGANVHLIASCRFCSKHAPLDEVARDAYQSFREQHPQLLRWVDRRPIGALMLARANMKWPTNPRGWLNTPNVDVLTTNGRAKFEGLIMQKAESCITNMRQMNAQGIIIWDIEGGQYPQGEATYVGDPRLLKRVAPEMDSVADRLFSSFRQAGFRVGVCLRADAINFRPNGSFYQKMFMDREELLRSLDERVTYAKSRWGCTLFYIDSFGGTSAYDPLIFKDLLEKHPDVLFIPEFEQTVTYAFAAPYKELRPMGKNPGTASTPWRATVLYPKAFTIINTADGDLVGRRAELVGAVRHGDVLLFRAWWADKGFQLARSIYEEGSAR
jgi:hypothetical protein